MTPPSRSVSPLLTLALLAPAWVMPAHSGVTPSSTSLRGGLSGASTAVAPQSFVTCELTPVTCERDETWMCMCQKLAATVASITAAYAPHEDSTDNSPWPNYLRANYPHDFSNGPSHTICHDMLNAGTIGKKCFVNCGIMEQYLRASQGQDAMVCEKALEEANLVTEGGIMDDGTEDDEAGVHAGAASSLGGLRL